MGDSKTLRGGTTKAEMSEVITKTLGTALGPIYKHLIRIEHTVASLKVQVTCNEAIIKKLEERLDPTKQFRKDDLRHWEE